MKSKAITRDDESEESSRFTNTLRGEDSGPSSVENSESEGDSADEHDVIDNEDVVRQEELQYEEVEIDPSPISITEAELEDDNNELWLMRIPSHLVKPASLTGKDIFINEKRDITSAENVDAGNFSTGYKFRDCGLLGTEHMRAAFVHESKKTHGGGPRLHIGMFCEIETACFVPRHFFNCFTNSMPTTYCYFHSQAVCKTPLSGI